jgi:hypothetical protein
MSGSITQGTFEAGENPARTTWDFLGKDKAIRHAFFPGYRRVLSPVGIRSPSKEEPSLRLYRFFVMFGMSCRVVGVNILLETLA